MMYSYFQNLTQKQKMGLVIKIKRKEQKLTQSDIGETIKCDQSVISRMELGQESISNELYELALNYLNINYQFRANEYIKLNKLFLRIWKAYEFVDYNVLDYLDELIFNNQVDHDWNIELHYDVLRCFNYFFKRDYQSCIELIDQIDPLVMTCDVTYQILYLIVKLNVLLQKGDYQNAYMVINHLESLEKDPYKDFHYLIAYFIGWYYFKKSNRTLVLNHLLFALDHYKQVNNHIRIFRIKIIINSFLIKEKNYDFAISDYKELLVNYKHLVRPFEIFWVYFWIGYCFYLKKDFSKAIDYFDQALLIKGDVDYNHVYFYLLKIYDELDDLENYRNVLKQINYDDQRFGMKIINLFLQSKIKKSDKYYRYIEKEILPLLDHHYDKLEISIFLDELINSYYESQQYLKYHELAEKMVAYFA